MSKLLLFFIIGFILSICSGANIGAAITNFKKGEYGASGINMALSFFITLVIIMCAVKQLSM